MSRSELIELFDFLQKETFARELKGEELPKSLRRFESFRWQLYSKTHVHGAINQLAALNDKDVPYFFAIFAKCKSDFLNHE